MLKCIQWIVSLALLVGMGIAQAQTAPSVVFTAQTTTGDKTVIPVLSWSTQPSGASCTASGSWTGAKVASGTETLPAITKSATYNLACTWLGSGDTATLTWVAPTQDTAGNPLTDLAGFKVYDGDSATAITHMAATYSSPTKLSGTLGPYAAGTKFFAITAFNAAGKESDPSNSVSKTFTANQQVTKSVGITVNAVPNPPTSVTVQ